MEGQASLCREGQEVDRRGESRARGERGGRAKSEEGAGLGRGAWADWQMGQLHGQVPSLSTWVPGQGRPAGRQVPSIRSGRRHGRRMTMMQGWPARPACKHLCTSFRPGILHLPAYQPAAPARPTRAVYRGMILTHIYLLLGAGRAAEDDSTKCRHLHTPNLDLW